MVSVSAVHHRVAPLAIAQLHRLPQIWAHDRVSALLDLSWTDLARPLPNSCFSVVSVSSTKGDQSPCIDPKHARSTHTLILRLLAMAGKSGYTGVRWRREKWQAFDQHGTYGSFDDPYQAACALAKAQQRPPPVRRPETLAGSRSAQEHIEVLTTAMLAVPPAYLVGAVGAALSAVALARATQPQISIPSAGPSAPSGGAAVSEVSIPSAEPAAAPPSAEPAAAPPSAEPTAPAKPMGSRKAKRMAAVINWYRKIWADGETFHLNTARPELYKYFVAHEWDRLGGELAWTHEEKQAALETLCCGEYELMRGEYFTKLLIEHTGIKAVAVPKRNTLYDSPVQMWEIDESYCPADVLEKRTIKLAEIRAEDERIAAERAQKIEDDRIAKLKKEADKLEREAEIARCEQAEREAQRLRPRCSAFTQKGDACTHRTLMGWSTCKSHRPREKQRSAPVVIIEPHQHQEQDNTYTVNMDPNHSGLKWPDSN